MHRTTTQFEHQDWEGTERARTDVNGNSAGTYFSLPFGDGYSYTGDDWNPYHFATLDQDRGPRRQVFVAGVEDNSANDHAQFREYSNMAGRWFSPDPYQGSYDPNNPQSFNRYAYALNNPLSFIDPSGLNVGHPCAGSPQCNNGDTNNPFEPGSGTGLGGLFSFTYITATWVPGQETNGPYIPGYWVYGTAVETFAFNNGPSGPFSPGGGGTAPNNDVPLEYDIFHCPSCVNTWKQADCVVSQPLASTGKDMVTGAGGAAFIGGVNNGAGWGGFIQGAWGAVKEGTATAGAVLWGYANVIGKTAWYTVMGCPTTP